MEFFLTDAWLAAAIAGIIGMVLAIPALISEWREHGEHHDMLVLIDVKPRFGKHLNHRELVFVSLLIHLLLSAVFGFVYVLFVDFGWLFVTGNAFSIASLLVYSVGVWMFNGIILFPLLGFGFFGKKEDGFAWLELLVTQFLLGLGLWVGVQLYQPFFF